MVMAAIGFRVFKSPQRLLQNTRIATKDRKDRKENTLFSKSLSSLTAFLQLAPEPRIFSLYFKSDRASLGIECRIEFAFEFNSR
jgi:hypothetical protein